MERVIDGNLDLAKQNKLIQTVEDGFWNALSYTQAPSTTDATKINRVTLIRRGAAENQPATLTLVTGTAGQSIAEVVNANAGKLLVMYGKAYVSGALVDVFGFRG
jgi:hypothetical protein